MSESPVVVTGAAGFVGARFVESLGARGTPVVSVDDQALFAPGARPEHTGLDFGATIDTDALLAWLAVAPAPAAIVHMGAITDTTCFDENLLRQRNLEYSQQLWDYCTDANVPLVYASSAATYGDGAHGYVDDEAAIDQLEPLNPYGESKQQFDLWALEQERDGRAPPQWSGWKFFNVYGFGERHKDSMASVVLKAYGQIRAGGAVTLFRSHHPDYADGEQSRDFVYIDDVVRVLHHAREMPIERGVYNLGTGTARPFRALVAAVFAELGVPENITWVDTPAELRERYQYFTQAEMGRLRATGYDAPFHTLEAGIRAYVRRLEAFDDA